MGDFLSVRTFVVDLVPDHLMPLGDWLGLVVLKIISPLRKKNSQL